MKRQAITETHVNRLIQNGQIVTGVPAALGGLTKSSYGHDAF